MSALGFAKRSERGFFDSGYYKATYADVAAARIDPFDHYMDVGWREGRNPSGTFNTLFYRDSHLAGANTNPLTHYSAAGGRKSGLATAPPSEDAFVLLQRPLVDELFDEFIYRQQTDASTQDLLGHYLKIGWRQGKAPNGSFDVTNYCKNNLYVKALEVSPLYHFASRRRLERARSSASRRAVTVSREDLRETVAPEFDAAFYLRMNPDVKAAKYDPLTHFLTYGLEEHRNPNPFFDAKYYLRANPAVARAKINPLYHYVTEGRPEGRRGNPVGTRLYPPLSAPPDEAWALAVAAADVESAEYVVIIPVYKGYDETLASIFAVLTAPQRTKFALHVVNDVTPDDKLDGMLAELAGRGLFSYSRNEKNVGFVKSCNRGLRLFADKEIVLLNADTTVHGDWLDRIARHAEQDPTIATITPLSNNATICSYPVLNENNLIEPERPASAMDEAAAACNAGRASDIPTGVGFCMFISRASRAKVGILDEEAFGIGYGEENDFCLRVAKTGFRNVLAEDIFVYHAGQVSFAELAATEYGPGQKALLGKHPDYPLLIRQHLEADPTALGRTRLDLYRLTEEAKPDCMVFVTHALEGGIVTHVERLEDRLLETGIKVVHLRVGVANRWSVQISSRSPTAPYCPNLSPMAFNQVKPLLAEFLDRLSPRAIHIHSLVGFDWSATEGLLDLIRGSTIPYYFTLHDYSVVCHRNDLVKPDGRYCGLPDVAICRRCVASDRHYPEALDPVVRRQTFGAFLAGAAAVFAPSNDIKIRLQGAGVPYEIIVRPHEEDYESRPVPRQAPDAAVKKIVVIGAIGAHKGSGLLLSLARDAKARKLPIRFHIVGYSDLREELSEFGIVESGRFESADEAVDLVEAIQPAYVFLPSIWPETFCYALSMAFMMNIPPIVFDLGAQRDRVLEAGMGVVLPYALIGDIRALNDRLVALPIETSDDKLVVPRQRYGDFLESYYSL